MQPHYTVDHETRHNLFRAEEEQAVTTEATPLLHRIAQSDIPSQSPSTTHTRVCLLLLILVFGAFISIYLLILQSESENVLPPVDMPLQLVSRYQWDHSNHSRQLLLHHSPFKATSVIIVHTETQQCVDIHTCIELLNELQKNSTGLQYNFLISSNGQTYEMLGWHEPSLMFPEVSNALVLAFIGNFTDIEPTRAQMLEANNFFAESISHQYLDPKFALIGKTTKNTPKQVFLKLKQQPQWKGEMSDEY